MYIIIEESDTQTLVDTVNEYVMEGFVPVGGVTIVEDAREHVDALFVQAMFNAKNPPKVAWVKPKEWIEFTEFKAYKDASEINKYQVEYVFKGEHVKREIVGVFDDLDDLKKTLELEANDEKSTR